MIYLVVIFLSASASLLAARCAGSLRLLLNGATAFPFVLMAGLRDPSIGTDVFAYAYWECRYSAGRSLIEHLDVALGSQGIGFALLTWITCSFAALPLSWLLGITQIFTVLPMLWAFNRLSQTISWLGIIAYGLLLFPFSLNGMKQSIAIAFVCVSCVHLIARRNKMFLAFIFLAACFHQTALIALFLHPLYRELVPNDPSRSFFGSARIPAIVGIGVANIAIAGFFGPLIIRALSGLKASYSYQLDRIGTGDFNLSFLALGFSFIFLFLLQRKDERPKDLFDEKGDLLATDVTNVQSFLLCAGLAGVLLAQLDLLSPSLGRLGWYGVAPIVFLPQISVIQQGRRSTAFSVCAILFIFFLGRTVVLELDQVYPYHFAV